MMGIGTRLGRAAAFALAAVVLTGCGGYTATDATGESPEPSPSVSVIPAPSEGSSEPSEPASEPVPEGTPECSAVWQEGAALPRTYAGCADPDGYVERDVLACSSGQRMVRYADRFYGVLGGTIHQASGPLEQDRDYMAAIRRCRA